MASLPSGGEQSDRDDYEYSTSDDDAEYSWIGWFCSRKGHEFLCEVRSSAQTNRTQNVEVRYRCLCDAIIGLMMTVIHHENMNYKQIGFILDRIQDV